MQRGAVYQPWPTPTEANPGLHELKYFDFGGSLASCCCWFFSQSWRKAKWSQVWKVSTIMGFFCFSRKSWMQKTPFPVPTSNQSAVHTHTVTHFDLCWFVEDGVCVGCTPRLHMLYIIKYARKHDTINRTLGGNIREFPTDFTRVKRGKTLLGVWCDCIIRAQQHQTCLTSSLLMVTVASATLRATGVQSSLLEEPIRLSIAPFSISMPDVEGDKTKHLN